MPLDLTQVLRIKGTIDATLAQAPADPLTATPGLVDTYLKTRARCAKLVAGTEAEAEFAELFPEVQQASIRGLSQGFDPIRLSAQGDEAKLRLAALSGWLGSWPSADELLKELTLALEEAEATAEGEDQARLRGILDGLRGAGRDVAVAVITAHLERQIVA